MTQVKPIENSQSVQSALEFIDVSVATLQQVHMHLEAMKAELDALKTAVARLEESIKNL